MVIVCEWGYCLGECGYGLGPSEFGYCLGVDYGLGRPSRCLRSASCALRDASFLSASLLRACASTVGESECEREVGRVCVCVYGREGEREGSLLPVRFRVARLLATPSQVMSLATPSVNGGIERERGRERERVSVCKKEGPPSCPLPCCAPAGHTHPGHEPRLRCR